MLAFLVAPRARQSKFATYILHDGLDARVLIHLHAYAKRKSRKTYLALGLVSMASLWSTVQFQSIRQSRVTEGSKNKV